MLDRIDIKYFKTAVGLESIGKETDVDITARCPVCGDSQTNKRKKRLHLYKKGDVTGINCFNGDCGVHNKTVYSFLRDFYPALLEQYKREQFGNTVEKLAKGEFEDAFSSINNKVEEQTEIVVQDLSPYMTKIEEKQEALDYLSRRGILYDKSYGQWYFGHQDLKIGEVLYKISNCIVIPLYYKDQMYGFYSRNIYNKEFYTYMNHNNIGYKIFNWFNIDKDKPVYIFEGIFDALSSGYHNIIALMGAKLPEERLNELKSPIFCLDNDRTGLVNSLEYVNKNKHVYIQPENLKEKDMNDLKLKHNYTEQQMRELIQSNIYSGIMAEIRIKEKL